MKKSKKEKVVLPKRAPKKTGKRGPRPLDPGDDFDSPAQAEPEEEQLLEIPEEAVPTVVGNRISAFYLKPLFSKTKTGEPLIAMQISFPITEEHTSDGLLPSEVREGWKFISKRGRKKLDLIELPGQRAQFFFASDDKEEALVLPAAKITNVSLAVVQKKGEGEARKVIRLGFRLQVPFSHAVARFAETNFGSVLWMTMQQTQESLFDSEEEE